MNVSKFLRLSLSAALLTSVVGMTGCGMNAKSNIRSQNVRNDQNHMRPYSTNEAGRYNAGYHHIGSMRFSSALSTQVAKLPGVRAAHVVLTDRDAYVAVRLMENNNTSRTNSYNRSNTNSYGLNGTTDMNNMYGNRGGNSIAGDIGRAGRDVGRGVVDTGRDIVGGVANTGRNVVNDIGNTGRNMMNDMTGRGNSGNTRMNSYNGTGTGTGMGMNQDQVPQNVRDEITRLIKRSNKVVQNVYISSDESFMNEVEGYSTNSRGGNVIQDTMTGFERLVNRIFPFGNGDNDMGVNNYRNNRMNNRMNNNMNMNNMDMMDRNPSGYQNGTR
ncbi:YhcN/YlaJ family sporulation lipoprotein [Paenibacillus turicensis]|uniref:YhcN/YlaJ family sporulation lipoprotein n=1 Tax=Paenibacillus turicensis TaxID=160487 RepID=UPI003D288AD5